MSIVNNLIQVASFSVLVLTCHLSHNNIVSLITRSVSMNPRDSIITRLTCTCINGKLSCSGYIIIVFLESLNFWACLSNSRTLCIFLMSQNIGLQWPSGTFPVGLQESKVPGFESHLC